MCTLVTAQSEPACCVHMLKFLFVYWFILDVFGNCLLPSSTDTYLAVINYNLWLKSTQDIECLAFGSDGLNTVIYLEHLTANKRHFIPPISNLGISNADYQVICGLRVGKTIY